MDLSIYLTRNEMKFNFQEPRLKFLSMNNDLDRNFVCFSYF